MVTEQKDKKQEVMEQLGIEDEGELRKKAEENRKKALEQAKKKDNAKKNGVSFEELCKQLPESGEILHNLNPEESTVVYEDWKANEGEPVRILYVNATIDDDVTGWYLHNRSFGLKCIITLRSQDNLAERPDGTLYCDGVRVLRKSNSGRGLICEAL